MTHTGVLSLHVLQPLSGPTAYLRTAITIETIGVHTLPSHQIILFSNGAADFKHRGESQRRAVASGQRHTVRGVLAEVEIVVIRAAGLAVIVDLASAVETDVVLDELPLATADRAVGGNVTRAGEDLGIDEVLVIGQAVAADEGGTCWASLSASYCGLRKVIDGAR